MRIGYLIPEFPGQTHIWIWREITHLRAWGTQIDIFSTKHPSKEVKAKHDFADAQTYYLWKQNILKNIFDIFVSLCWAVTRPIGLYKAIKLVTIDVEAPRWRIIALVPIACVLARSSIARSIEHIHCHSCANSAILAMMLKQLTGISYSLTLNANLEWWGGGLTAKFSNAAFIIAITQKLEEEVRLNYPLHPNQVVLGRIGVDTAKWNPQLYKLNNLTNQTFQILTVGRLHTSKGHDTVIQAVKCLVDAGKLVNLTIIGAGSELENLKTLAAKLEISHLVEFTGSLSEDQIIEKMLQADAFVLASHAEPLGVVYMEAMAMEVATIGTNAGGVPEIITDGKNGLLIPPRDVTALTRALIQLIENPAFRIQLGLNGRSSIIEHFDSQIGAATLFERITIESGQYKK
ncbi:group 1 glycosyl transferase [Calothrix sp. NIES-4071]|nr:group 1 glycosyl transferase [Calothrix sp. NIES-4071]BAZ62672.1 group 1 glycosyl transferase [Calothrix sp. NIES-4105]